MFENLEDQVRIDEKILERDGFEVNTPAFSCIVAEFDTKVVGYAFYYATYSTWLGRSIFLEDLYVMSDYRNKGLGRKLIMAVAKRAYELGGRLDFHVLSWNPAVEFYKNLGAVDLSSTEKWSVFRLSKENLHKLFDKK